MKLPSNKPIVVNHQSIGFPALLTLLFIGAKLFGAIDWSWWWVLSPLWIPIALIIVFGVGVVLFFVSMACWEQYNNNKKKRARENKAEKWN